MTNSFSHFLGLSLVLGLIALSACNPAPNYSRPTTPTPPSYKEAPSEYKEVAGWKIADPSDDKIRPKWWEMYNDPRLNELEEQVQISNQSIVAAEANFRAARAVVVQARASLFPTVTANPSITNSRISSARGSLASAGTSTTPAASGALGTGVFTDYELPIDVSYTIDLWHNIRNNIAANAFTAQASAADVATALLSTQAEVAQDYFEVRELDQQRAVLADTIRNYQQTLELTTTLYRSGLDSEQDVAQAKTQLDTTAAQATDLGVARAQYEHAIATLIGKPASEFSLPIGTFIPKPPEVPVAIPSKLLERRPDIASMERQVASANAKIGVAKAAYYPTLSLGAALGFESTSPTTWFSWPSRFWSVGPTLAQTLFDAGARRGATEQAQATYDAAVANYRQTVLTDFQTVEDNLAALRILAQEVEQQQEAINSSQYYLDLALTRYRSGIDSYLNVITAQTTLLSNQVTQLQIQLRQMTSSVNLIMALGGGWEVSDLPQVREVSRSPKQVSGASQTSPAADRVAPPNPPPVH
jgi:NodT family efflux transporter outer membrane factor (OMF) lipoprotein